MKLKLSEILNINQILKTIIDGSEINIEPIMKFKMLGIMKSFEDSITNFESIRNDLIMKLGTADDNGNVSIDKNDTDTIKKFNEELTKVLSVETDVTFTKLKATEIFNKGIKAEYLTILYPIIEE